MPLLQLNSNMSTTKYRVAYYRFRLTKQTSFPDDNSYLPSFDFVGFVERNLRAW